MVFMIEQQAFLTAEPSLCTLFLPFITRKVPCIKGGKLFFASENKQQTTHTRLILPFQLLFGLSRKVRVSLKHNGSQRLYSAEHLAMLQASSCHEEARVEWIFNKCGLSRVILFCLNQARNLAETQSNVSLHFHPHALSILRNMWQFRRCI